MNIKKVALTMEELFNKVAKLDGGELHINLEENEEDAKFGDNRYNIKSIDAEDDNQSIIITDDFTEYEIYISKMSENHYEITDNFSCEPCESYKAKDYVTFEKGEGLYFDHVK